MSAPAGRLLFRFAALSEPLFSLMKKWAKKIKARANSRRSIIGPTTRCGMDGLLMVLELLDSPSIPAFMAFR